SIPYRLLHEFQIPVYDAIRERDADFYARLEKAGFMLDFGDDNSGLFMKYLRRGSGYYIDVGASELVANGHIKLESGVDVVRLTENAVVLSNGKTLPADLIVYATRSEEHTSELQSRFDLVCRLLLEKKKNQEILPISNVCLLLNMISQQQVRYILSQPFHSSSILHK